MNTLVLMLIPAVLLAGLVYLSVTRLRSTTGPERIRRTADAIEGLLPQTQCGKCGYPGCRPYAEAIARGAADINQCPPGGDTTLQAMATLLGRNDHISLPNPAVPGLVALIDEDLCIGCVKCISACPVDAIIGAPKKMHTVIRQNCTGCGLCITPCPVNCIRLVPVRVKTPEWVWDKPDPSLRLRG